MTVKEQVERTLDKNSEDLVRKTIVPLVGADAKGFREAVLVLIERRAPSSLLANVVRDVMQRCGCLLDESVKVDFYAALFGYVQGSPSFKKEAGEVQGLFVASCEKSGSFRELASFYESLPFDEDDFEEWDVLKHYLLLGECHQRAGSFDRALSHVTKASRRIFRLRTPRELIERYDRLRAYVAIDRADFAQAAQCFVTLSGYAPGDQVGYLRQAMVYAILAGASRRRQSLVAKIMSDERCAGHSVLRLLERLNGKQLVLSSDVSAFESELCNEYGFRMDALEKSVREHNLHGIAQMYSSISLKRLASIVGASIDDVVGLMGGMISTGKVVARIDQPSGMVIYDSDVSADEARDAAIEGFCRSVQSLSTAVSSC